MIFPQSEILDYVCEEEITRQLFGDHFDGAVLIDWESGDIIGINEYLTGKFEKYMDKSDISYSHNLENFLSECVDGANRSALKERAAPEAVTERLASRKSYNVGVQLNSEKNGMRLSKRF